MTKAQLEQENLALRRQNAMYHFLLRDLMQTATRDGFATVVIDHRRWKLYRPNAIAPIITVTRLADREHDIHDFEDYAKMVREAGDFSAMNAVGSLRERRQKYWEEQPKTKDEEHLNRR